MAAFKKLVSGLTRAEHELEAQLAGVRAAISSLRFGSAVSPAMPTGKKSRTPGPEKRRAAGAVASAASGTVKRKPLSAAARRKISAAQKKRWAKVKANK